MFHEFTLESFTPHTGGTFRFGVGEAEWVDLTLVEAVDRTRAVPGAGEQFALMFHGPLDRRLTQGTFEVSNETLGVFPLFIVPIGMDADGMQYEVIFTRLAPPRPASTP